MKQNEHGLLTGWIIARMQSGDQQLLPPARVALNLLAGWHRQILAGSVRLPNEGGDKSSSMPVSAEVA